MSLYLGAANAANLISLATPGTMSAAAVPAAVAVLPGPAAANTTSVDLLNDIVTAGQPIGLSVLPRDALGNALLPMLGDGALQVSGHLPSCGTACCMQLSTP